MPRTSQKRRLELGLEAGIIQEALFYFLDLNPTNIDKDNPTERLQILVAVYTQIAQLRYLNQGLAGSASHLPVENALTEFLDYPDNGFLSLF